MVKRLVTAHTIYKKSKSVRYKLWLYRNSSLGAGWYVSEFLYNLNTPDLDLYLAIAIQFKDLRIPVELKIHFRT